MKHRTEGGKQKLALACLVIVSALMLSCTPAFACYSCLLLVPTTDTVAAGRYTLDMQYDFTPPARSDTSFRYMNTEFGIAKGLEAGVDFDLSEGAGSSAIANAKYAFTLGGTKLPAAVGIYSLNTQRKSTPFACVAPSFNFGRITFGALRTADATQWYAGFDRALNKKWMVMAEYTDGNENFSALSLCCTAGHDLSVVAGAEFPNSGTDTYYSVHLIYSGGWSK